MAKVIVYSTRRELWRPLLDAGKSLDVEYRSPEQYTPNTPAGVVILDRFAPHDHPAVPSLWVNVPATGSPFPVKTEIVDKPVTYWTADSELGAGLHARDLLLPKAEVFQVLDRDFAVASTSAGPVAVIRPASETNLKLAAVGFDLLAEPLRYRVSSPILFANLMRWLAPQAFRSLQISVEPVGLESVALDEADFEGGAPISVYDEAGLAIPFLIQNRTLQFFGEKPAVVHVKTGQRERILSLVLPQVADYEWNVPAAMQHSPGSDSIAAKTVDLWQVLACLGGLGLLVEWLLFGRSRTVRFPTRSPAPSTRVADRSGELVSR